MTAAARLALKIDIVVDAGDWKAAKVGPLLRRAINTAAAATRSPRKSATPATELAVVLTDDSAVRLLNRDWRGIDAATNVLSFPTAGRPSNAAVESPLGDIVLAFETVAREAQAERKPFAHHVAHLAVHGFLHLIGYDHQREEDAEAMERTERDILRRLAIPDPYRSRAQHSPARRAKHSGRRRSKPSRT